MAHLHARQRGLAFALRLECVDPIRLDRAAEQEHVRRTLLDGLLTIRRRINGLCEGLATELILVKGSVHVLGECPRVPVFSAADSRHRNQQAEEPAARAPMSRGSERLQARTGWRMAHAEA